MRSILLPPGCNPIAVNKYVISALIFETTQMNGTVFVLVNEHNLDEATKNTLSVVTTITASSYDLSGVYRGLEKTDMHTEFGWENLLQSRHLRGKR
jgi:hypothetical protein